MASGGIPWPDLSGHPHSLTVERDMLAPPEAVYRSWTVDLDKWMAAPGRTLFKPEVGAPFYFETDFNGRRYPHYGRFLALEPNRKVVITWVSGPSGTGGAETVLSLDLKPDGTGTHARLTQAGFLTDKAAREHEHAWHVGLRNLDALLSDT
ncbi:MAG: SRPBCC family protein [Sporichthyaceae bacterium]